MGESDHKGLIAMMYKDVARPSAERIGMTLGNIIGTSLIPIDAGNYFFRDLLFGSLKKYVEKIERVKKEDLTLVPPEISVPIIKKLSYVKNEIIADMFIELLAKASTKSEAGLAHPNFINIVSSISPDEAEMLVFMIKNEVFYLSLSDGNFQSLKMFSEFQECDRISNYSNLSLYLDNLTSLGIITVDNVKSDSEEIKRFDALYDISASEIEQQRVEFKNKTGVTKMHVFKKYKDREVIFADHGNYIQVFGGVYKFTDFGKKFIEATQKKI